MRVALIDDGVVPQVVPRLPARNDLCVLEDGTIRQRRQDEPVLTDHGTTSAQILHMYAPEAEICFSANFFLPQIAGVGRAAGGCPGVVLAGEDPLDSPESWHDLILGL